VDDLTQIGAVLEQVEESAATERQAAHGALSE
jgi:hypothetical protein